MAAAMLLLGAALFAVGIGLIFWPAGLIAAGVLLVTYGAIDEYAAAHQQPEQPPQ